MDFQLPEKFCLWCYRRFNVFDIGHVNKAEVLRHLWTADLSEISVARGNKIIYSRVQCTLEHHLCVPPYTSSEEIT